MMREWLVFAVLAAVLAFLSDANAQTTTQPAGAPFREPVSVESPYKASVIYSNLTSPGGIAVDPDGNLLVVEKGLGVTLFRRLENTVGGRVEWSRTVLITNKELTHSIAYQSDGIETGRILVSTRRAILAYFYNSTTRVVDSRYSPFSVVSDIPSDGVPTHRFILDNNPTTGRTQGYFVGTGPHPNDSPSTPQPGKPLLTEYSQVRRIDPYRYPSPPVYPPAPTTWRLGTIIAYGLYSPSGFAVVPATNSQSLYILDSGASLSGAQGITDTFARQNPAGELNVVNTPIPTPPYPYDGMAPPTGFGYPDCVSLWNGTADPVGVPEYVEKPAGTQVSRRVGQNDTFCGNEENNKAPKVVFEANSAPFDLAAGTGDAKSAFPQGSAFVTLRDGRGVAKVSLDGTEPGYSYILQARTCLATTGCLRPTGLVFGKDPTTKREVLYVTSDTSGELFLVSA